MESLDLIRNTVSLPWAGLGLIIAAPLLGAALNGLAVLGTAWGLWRAPKSLHTLLGLGGSAVALLVSLFAWNALLAQGPGGQLVQDLGPWMDAGALHVKFGLQLDALSLVMILFVTFVGFLIHVYSVGYMAHDPGYGRFFTYLNLFLAAMLILVLSDNLVALFVGWEGVGLCSFLLISFWFEDEAKAEAGKKAFLTNRIGDAGFLLGTFLVLAVAGTVSFAELQAQRQLFTPALATAACLLFFMGATGKSAQIPLYVWLPDAMAGPTPVSALIHAATMVTAGVYLVARLHFLFSMSPTASAVVAVVGALTALLAALIALAQNDIKKVLAYSTISQLGYMFTAVGVGAYGTGLFHVMTHAFFKACLFLGAGSVIHAVHEEQDIRKMGGLLKHLPVTGITFVVASAALSGIPPLAGFFSKDAILWKALSTPNASWPALPAALYGILLFTALLTAFYMTRLVVLTFFGEYRGGRSAQEKLHESPKTMTYPLVVLALGSFLAGWLGTPHAIGGHDLLGTFLDPIFRGSAPESDGLPDRLEVYFMLVSVLVAILGIGLGWAVYARRKTSTLEATERRIPFLKGLLVNKFWVDEIYDATILAFVRFLARWVSFWFLDTQVIERVVHTVADAFKALGRLASRLSTGSVRLAAAGMAAGAALLLYWLMG